MLVMEKLLLGEEDDDARGCSDHASADTMEGPPLPLCLSLSLFGSVFISPLSDESLLRVVPLE